MAAITSPRTHRQDRAALNPEIRHANKNQVCAFFEIKLATLDAWLREGCPWVQKGHKGVPWILDLLHIAEWRFLGKRDPDMAEAGPDDPRRLPPKERLDHYRAEREALRLDTERGDLIPVTDVEDTLGAAFKLVAQTLDTLPDILERDCSLDPRSVARTQQAIDALREDLYQRMVKE